MKKITTFSDDRFILSGLRFLQFGLIGIVLLFASFSSKLNAQCTTCKDGVHYPDSAGHYKPRHAGSGTLGLAYKNENICGLNYVEGSTLVETRSVSAGINTNGVGLPGAIVNIPNSFPSACFKILDAYCVWDDSYTTSSAGTATLTVKNPAGTTFTYTVPVAGTSIPKCWGETGTACYYGDINTSISGPGNYTVGITGTGISGSSVDGVTIFIIYQDLSATYSGSIAFYDGEITTTSADINYTATGFSVCSGTSNAQAFALQADMQQGVNGNINTDTYNGTGGTFNNNFWNFNSVNTTVTTGQTTAAFDTYTNNSNSDCYSLLFVGLYWQNTNCVTCNPVLPNVSVSPSSASVCSSSGGVTLTATGAVTYSWQPGSLTGASVTVNPATTTTYTVTGADINGCTGAPATVTVTVGAGPSGVSATSNSPVCAGATLNLNGAGTGATSWSWSGPNSFSSSSQNATIPGVTAAAAGTYTLSATNACGTTTSTVAVTINPLPTSVTATSNSPVCAGSTLNLIGGGTGVTTWAWSGPGAYSSGSQSPNITSATVAESGTYTLTASNACGPTTSTVAVVVNPLPTITITPASPGICPGGNVTLTGSGGVTYVWSTSATTSSINVSPAVTTTYTLTGTDANGCVNTQTVTVNVGALTVTANASSPTICSGTPSVLTGGGATGYVWSDGETTGTINVTPATTTTYTVTGTAGGCTATATVTVTVNPTPTLTATATSTSICSGTTTLLTGTGATGYSWTPSGSVLNPTSDTTTAYPTATTTYTLTGTTGTCSDTVSVTVTVNSAAVITASAVDTTICTGTTATLSANGGSLYVWMPGSLSGSPVTVNPSSNTVYTVTGTTASGCSGTATVSISVTPTPTINISTSGTSDTVCSGGSITLTANGTATNYIWSNGATTSSITVSPASAGTYSVFASNGVCGDSASQPVNMYPPFVVSMVNDSACSAGMGVMTVNATGGGKGYTYVWSNGTTGVNSITVPSTNAGYTCTVTDACGDVSIDSAHVVTFLSPTASFTPTPNPVPGGQYVSFVDNSTNASKWYWTMGDGTSSTSGFPYYQYDTTGNYLVTLTVWSKNGCRDSIADTVHVIELIFVPNVFTPNGDGINDVFHVTADGVKTYSIEIFNRWGQRVFATDSPNIDWDGRSSGGVMESDGTYYYVILATDYAGKNFKYDGYLQLIGGGGN